jgi:hypothetical protein
MSTNTITTITDTQQRPQPFTSTSALSLFHNIETMLIKQGKQIRALYELQKATFERVSSIQNQLKKLTSDDDTELNSKVFSVSTVIII